MKYIVLNVRDMMVYVIEIIGETYTILKAHKKISDPPFPSEAGEKGRTEDLRENEKRRDFETLEEAEEYALLEVL